MGLQWVLDFFRKVAPESLSHLDPPDTVTWEEYRDAVRLRREFEVRAKCFEAELLRRGETERSLDARVQMFKRTLLNTVKAA